MQVGIFTGYFPYGLEETAREDPGARLQHGAARPALQGRRPVAPARSPRTRRKQVRDTFRDHDLPICCISGYTNIIHPDQAERERRVGYLKEIIRHARHLGSPYVISETGTYNTECDWVHHPKNKTEEGFEECREVDRRPGADRLRPRRGVPARDLRQQRRRLGRGDGADVRRRSTIPGLGLLMDPTNYFETHNIDAMDQVLNQVFDTLTDKIRIAHAKDVKRSGDDKSREARRHRRRGRAGVATPSAASARSSCRRPASARSTTTST